MHTQHNNLRLYRKRSQLTQADIAFILQLPDYTKISRWEKGKRGPSIEVLIIYHLLFDIPITSLFERQKHELRDSLKRRISLLIEELQALPPEPKVTGRIAFLDTVLTRLNS